jgi:hypothetical protein
MKFNKAYLFGIKSMFFVLAALLLISLPVSAAYQPDNTLPPSGITIYQWPVSPAQLGKIPATVNADSVVVTGGASDIPSALYPADGTLLKTGVTKVVIMWNLPAGYTKKEVKGYHWQFSDESAFDYGFDISGKWNKIIISGLWPNQDYYWRVKTLFKDGTESDFSPTCEVSTALTKAPALSSPKNNSKQVKPAIKFSWKKPVGTPKSYVHYMLQYSTDPTFATYDYWTTTKTSLSVPASYIPKANLTLSYYWRVQVLDGSETQQFSAMSASRMFIR